MSTVLAETEVSVHQDAAAFLVAVASKKPQDPNAERVYRMAVELDPKNAEARFLLGRLLLGCKENGSAAAHLLEAIKIDPKPAYYVLLAEAWRRGGYPEGAIQMCETARGIDDACIAAYIQQAAICQQSERDDAALEAIARGLAIDPNNHDLLFSRALIELGHGDFENGWRDFDYRPSRLEMLPKCAEHPEWTGESLDGKTLLIIGEQGLGDQIMFARYIEALPVLAHTMLFTKPELARLFDGLVDSIITSDRELVGLKPDYWIGIGSLPRYVKPGPAHTGVPRLSGVDRFARLIPKTGNLRVGLCWAGNPQHRNDDQRSLAFEQLAPLLDVPGVDFYALQAGAPSAQNDGRAFNLIAHCHDMADTAAAIMNLDLVITVDTAVLHLAGALGKQAWGLIARPCDWRWGAGARTPLYPSVELFRQRERGEWRAVIDQVRDRLCYEDYCEVATLPYGESNFGNETRNTTYEHKTAECRYGTMAFYPNDAYIGRALDLYGEYSQSEADLLTAILKPGDVVIEAGANIGGLTLSLAEAVGPNGFIWAFEPQERYLKLLRANCARRGHIAAKGLALSDEDGIVTLPGIPMDRIHAPGWRSDEPQLGCSRHAIDNLGFSRVSLIKVDVDGQEQEILIGAEQTIARCRPFIYVENDKPEAYPDLIPWLDAHGYRVYQHFAPLYNPDNFRGYMVNVFGKIVSAMLFCVPKERYGFDDIVERFKLDRLVVTRA